MNKSSAREFFQQLPTHQPTTILEAQTVVRDAIAAELAVYPIGGATLIDYGFPPTRPGVVIQTVGMNKTIDYPARDMTITLEAGATLASIQQQLSAENQWLPIDVPHADKATIGGAVATNVSGPRRLGYGTLRDYVIGISFLTDDATEVKAGGRVVKNVAGYDLMKLHTGALGSFGLITQLTLKVKPRPEAFAVARFDVNSGHLAKLLDVMHGSKSRPVAIELLSAGAARLLGMNLGDNDWRVLVGFEEKAKTVAWQCETLATELRGQPIRDWQHETFSTPPAVWNQVTDLQTHAASEFIWKLSCKPSELAAIVTREAILGQVHAVHAQPLSGICWFHSSSEAWPNTSVGDWLSRRVPSAHANLTRIAPRTGVAADMMRHLKEQLDPKHVWNPGRFFGEHTTAR